MSNWPPKADILAWAELIKRYAPYDVFGCLTFPQPIRDTNAHAIIREYFQYVVRKLLQKHVRLVLGWEFQIRDVNHYHFLAGIMGQEEDKNIRINPSDMKDLWHKRTGGNSKVAIYIPNYGGEEYLAGHQHKSPPLVLCPRHSSCRHGKHCLKDVGPFSWPGVED